MPVVHSKLAVVVLTMLGSICFVIVLALIIAAPIVGLGIALGVLH